MAKKTVATLQEGKKDGRSYTKVIKMVKNPENGAYFFDEKMVPNEAVQDFFKNLSLNSIFTIYPLATTRGFFISANTKINS